MDALSKLSRALAIIRRTGQPLHRKAAGAPASATEAQRDASELNFRAQVAARLRTLERRDPNFRNASTRVFLEQVLLREFGEGVLGSREFQQTLQEVQRVMEANEAMRAELEALVEQLASSPGVAG